jgi:hypothetical protein
MLLVHSHRMTAFSFETAKRFFSLGKNKTKQKRRRIALHNEVEKD